MTLALSAVVDAGAPALNALDRIVRAVSVVSACEGASIHATTVDSLAVACPDPMRVVVAVRRTSRWWELVATSRCFAVSVLAGGQEDLARRFASRRRGRDVEQLSGLRWHTGAYTGAPLLDAAAVWFECDLETAAVADDQVLVVGRVVGEARHGPARSVLVRVGGGYASAAGPTPAPETGAGLLA